MVVLKLKEKNLCLGPKTYRWDRPKPNKWDCLNFLLEYIYGAILYPTFMSIPGECKTRMERIFPTRPRTVNAGISRPWWADWLHMFKNIIKKDYPIYFIPIKILQTSTCYWHTTENKRKRKRKELVNQQPLVIVLLVNIFISFTCKQKLASFMMLNRMSLSFLCSASTYKGKLD